MRSEAQITTRNSATLPQTTQTPVFKVQGGRVLVFELGGKVTVATPSGTNNTKYVANPDVGNDVDLCATVDLASKAIGTLARVNGDLSDALELSNGAQEILNDYRPVLVDVGTIDLSCSASKTGEMLHSIRWCPLDEGARVVRA